MPFIGALSGTNLTNMRGDYNGRSYVCVTPATIKLQAQINITQTGKRASLTYASVVTGSHSDLKDGMLVIVHADQNDLYNYWWRGRVRGTASSGTIPINETDLSFFVNYYVTVIEDYDVMPRLARRANDANYVDYDLAFATLPPAIGGLQSSYVVHTTSTTTSLSFAPTVSAMEKDATITTYLWDVSDGTITNGTTATKDITVSFPAYQVSVSDGHRWVSLTATDSNSVTHTFRFEVFVGNLNTAPFVLQDVDNISWSADWNSGYNASITLHGDGSTLLPNQRLTIAYRDLYSAVTTPMNTSVAMVGRIKGDVISNTGVDWLKETRFTVEGFGTQLANLACPKFAMFDVDTPAEWNDIEDPTPVRAIWHTVTRYSTFATVCAFDFLSDYNDYVTGAIEIEAQGMLDGLNRVAGRIMAQVTFAPSGEWRIRQTASYLSQATKDTLTTVASITTQDMLDFTIERQHAPRVGYVEGGASIYDPATKTYAAYIAKAPSIMNTSGEEVQQINGIILDSTSPSTATTQLGLAVGGTLARAQNVYRLQVNFFDAWREIVPSNYEWYTFTIADDDNNRGVSIGTGRYYLLESVSWSADIATGTLTINAQFVQDVDAFGSAQDVARIPNLTTPYPGQPIQLPYGDTYLPDGAGTTYNPTDNPDANENPIPPSALDPITGTPETGGGQPLGNQGVYYVPFTGAVVGTNFNSVGSAIYTLEVSGVAELGAITSEINKFGVNGDWDNYTVAPPETSPPYPYIPAYDAATGKLYGASVSTIGVPNSVGINFIRDMNGATLTSITVNFEYNKTRAGTETSYLSLDGVQVDTNVVSSTGAGTGTLSWTGSQAVDELQIYIYVRNLATGGGSAMTLPDGSYMRITSIAIELEASAGGTGDAFYYGFSGGSGATLYTVGEGFTIDSQAYPVTPAYNDTHTYTGLQWTGDGSQITFKYQLSDYTGVESKYLRVKITGQNAR
jgi:hypothetical protein